VLSCGYKKDITSVIEASGDLAGEEKVNKSSKTTNKKRYEPLTFSLAKVMQKK